MAHVTTFTTDGSVDPLSASLLTLVAGDTEAIAVLVEGFLTGDTITSVKLYAKLDPTDTDVDADTVVLTGVLTTPARDPNARLVTFTAVSADTIRLTLGRVYRVEAIVTRSAVQYTRTIMLGFIAAAYPGSDIVAPSDEAVLRAAGDAFAVNIANSKLSSVTGVTDRTTVGGTATAPIVDIAPTYEGQTSIDTVGTITDGEWAAGQVKAPIVITPSDPRYNGAVGNLVADDTTEVNATIAALAALTPPGVLELQADMDYLVTSLPNTTGVPIVGPGRIMKAIAGGYQQLNSYGDLHQRVFGVEYLTALYDRLKAGLPCSIVLSGTSTTTDAGGLVSANYVPDAILARLAAAAGATQQTFYNHGQSGEPIGYLVSTSLALDLTANGGGPPTAIIFKWGENDPPAGVAAFITNMRSVLTTVRDTANCGVDKMAILLMPPAGLAQPSTGRDERWGEAIAPGLRQLAREFHCCFYDTYAVYRDARTMAGSGWSPDGVHPLESANATIYTDVARLLYPAGIVGLTGPANSIAELTPGNGWSNVGSSPLYVLRSAAGGYITTPRSVAMNVTGDMAYAVEVAATHYLPATTMLLGSRNQADNDGSWDFYIAPNGKLAYRWTANGTYAALITAVSTVATGVTDGTRVLLGFIHRVNDGAGNNTVSFWQAPAGTVDQIGTGAWTQIGTTIPTVGITSRFAPVSNWLEVGSGVHGQLPFLGTIYNAKLWSGLGTALVATCNPQVSAPYGATSFTATTGEVWTLTDLVVAGARLLAVKTPHNITYIQGDVTGGTTTATTVIATLPVGKRPGQDRYYTCATLTPGVPAIIVVRAATGNIEIVSCPSNGLLSLDGIAFLTA